MPDGREPNGASGRSPVEGEPVRVPARKVAGRVAGLYAALGRDFVTAPAERLDLGFEGIAGDRHGGLTRRSGGREPWYPRGTILRNERQLSLLSPAELDEVARRLGLPEVRPEWIGGNMLVEGVERLSCLPPRTLLLFAGGVTLKVDGDNPPCRASGRALARRCPDRTGIEAGFVEAARHRRGLVAWVEKPGSVAVGERFAARLPEQWIYR